MDSHVSKKAVIDVIDNFNVFQSREDLIALERKIAEKAAAEKAAAETFKLSEREKQIIARLGGSKQ